MLKWIKKRLNLAITLVLFVFSVMMASFVVVGGMTFALHRLGVLNGAGRGPLYLILALLLICILLGTALTAFFSEKALKPIRKIINATHSVAQGDFKVEVDIRGIEELEELSQSFNKMAQELSRTETLRHDFINNFSHEFKTPIVSVRGFAKLLKEGDLSKEETQEYLNIIIAESERLAQLSTNILNLAKYETIEIVADQSPFRLDEQIRRAVLMTEPKWSAKHIDMNIEMDEITFCGNEDLTQQIWLNLLDNAIKFSPESGQIIIRLSLWNGHIRFMIRDSGLGMYEQIKAHIFDKFYQGETSHAKEGNGLGLAIVKRITELYGGGIDVQSEVGVGSTFTVTLPYC